MTSLASATPRRTSATPARIAGWSAFRIVGAAAILVAVGHQLIATVSRALTASEPYAAHLATVLTNFFSFFTIESNVSAAVALIVAAVWALRHRDADREPRGIAVLLACVSTYMIVTGIVYNTLLRGIPLPQGTTVIWANEMLHVVGPLILLVDVLFAPGRRRLGWGTLGTIAAFPIVWAVYTLVRANLVVSPTTGEPWWYPYPFLNPNNFESGYLVVALYVIGIAAGILVVGAGVIGASRMRRR